jgi:hypothetical protein
MPTARHRPIPDGGSRPGRYHNAPGCCASRRTPPLIRNHEQGAVNAAIEEVAVALGQFLDANRSLKARERHAYTTALEAVSGARYAATVWAAARRNGQYYGLNLAHQAGVGAAQDAVLRSREWFTGLKMHLGALRANPDLALAVKTIDQIEQGIEASRRAFAEAVQTAGAEVYREPLQQANEMWSACAEEWGWGPGFKDRVLGRLRRWFDENSGLKGRLEQITLALWEEKVVQPIERLARETSPGTEESV